MNLHITHPRVRKVIEKCEQEVRELTGNPAVAISFIDNYYLLDFDQIAGEVCKVTRVSMDDIKSDSRKKEIVQARHLICFCAKRFTRLNFRQIGELIGDRDHTTVISGINRLKDLIDAHDEQACDLVNKVNRRLRLLVEEK